MNKNETREEYNARMREYNKRYRAEHHEELLERIVAQAQTLLEAQK